MRRISASLRVLPSTKMWRISEPQANYYACAGSHGWRHGYGPWARPGAAHRRVLVMTGDGELLMNVGSLATVAIMPSAQPVYCLCRQWPLWGDRLSEEPHVSWRRPGSDRCRRRYSGSAHGHARGGHCRGRCAHPAHGRASVCTPQGQATDPPKVRRSMDAAWSKHRFQDALLGTR